jgi:hypothetical protein
MRFAGALPMADYSRAYASGVGVECIKSGFRICTRDHIKPCATKSMRQGYPWGIVGADKQYPSRHVRQSFRLDAGAGVIALPQRPHKSHCLEIRRRLDHRPDCLAEVGTTIDRPVGV